jgi:hypothetical protein
MAVPNSIRQPYQYINDGSLAVRDDFGIVTGQVVYDVERLCVVHFAVVVFANIEYEYSSHRLVSDRHHQALQVSYNVHELLARESVTHEDAPTHHNVGNVL